MNKRPRNFTYLLSSRKMACAQAHTLVTNLICPCGATGSLLKPSQVPARLALEPMRLATGNAVALDAGATLPETTVAVLSGAGARLVRGALGGERRQAFSITQRLWRLAPAGPGEQPA